MESTLFASNKYNDVEMLDIDRNLMNIATSHNKTT
jgi:hypothetical protein